MPWILAAVVLAAIVSWLFYSRASYYRRFFSPEHFREVHSTFLELLREQSSSMPRGERAEKPSGTVTSAGLVLGVTSRASDKLVVHVSLSQHERPTTAAVANRFGFFLLSVLNRNKLEMDLFFTDTGVHHLIFTGEPVELTLNDFARTFETYQSTYRPLPFTLRSLEELEPEAQSPGTT